MIGLVRACRIVKSCWYFTESTLLILTYKDCYFFTFRTSAFCKERGKAQVAWSDGSRARWRPSSTNGSPWSQLKVVSLELGTLHGWLQENILFKWGIFGGMRNAFLCLSGSIKFFIFMALRICNSNQSSQIWMIGSVLDHWSTRQGIAALLCDPWWRGTAWHVISSVVPCLSWWEKTPWKKTILDRLSPYICQQSPPRMLEDLVLQETLKKNMFRKGMVLISVIHLWQESKPCECFWILSSNMWIPDAFVLVCAALLFLEASEAVPVNLIAESHSMSNFQWLEKNASLQFQKRNSSKCSSLCERHLMI